jgi:L-amino acid N-acyltransferase YncA
MGGTVRDEHSAKALVRGCTPDDLPAIQRIYAHYVLTSVATFEETPPPVGYWQGRYDEIRGLGLPFLVAELDGRVVGYCFCSRWRPRPAYRRTVEDSIYLDPEAVGKGIGRALLTELLALCDAAGIREIVAVIATGPEDASAALHRRLGFRDVGTLSGVGFKFDRWIDTILMQRSTAQPDS